jgi:hypothetical protein
VRRAVAGGAGGGRRDAATASHLNAATFPESKEPECNVPPMLMLLLSLLVGAARVAEDLSEGEVEQVMPGCFFLFLFFFVFLEASASNILRAGSHGFRDYTNSFGSICVFLARWRHTCRLPASHMICCRMLGRVRCFPSK